MTGGTVNRCPFCFFHVVLIWTLTASAVPGTAAAQSNPPADAATPGKRTSISVVVTDKKGKPIRDLQASDFSLLDNKEPQKLLAFRVVDANTPAEDLVHVVIVVDMINTGVNVVSREREQLGEFLKQNGGELTNPTSIATFAQSGAKVGRAFTRDGNALSAMFSKQQNELRSEGRSTGFWGAVDRLRMSLNQLGELLSYEATVPGRKLIVVIGPGWPLLPWTGAEADLKQRTQVFSSIVQLTNRIEQAHVALYCIDPYELGRSIPFYYQNYLKVVSAPKNAEYGDIALQVLAVHSGGQVLVKGPDILGGLETAVQDASQSYELIFAASPGERPDEFHALEVHVNRPNMIVRTISGYYASPQVLGP